MSTTAAEPDLQAKARRLRRWTWGMVALAFALMVGAGAMLKLAPDLVGETFGRVLGAAAILGVASYFLLRGESAWRKARANWVAALVLLLGVAPAMFVAQRLEQKQEVEKMQAIVAAMGEQFKKADQDYADRMKAVQLGTAMAVLGSERVADAAARAEARATFAAAIKTVDEALAQRARIPEENIAKLRATAAPAQVKQAAEAAIRTVAAGPAPLVVQMLNGTRAFLVKATDMLVHLDKYAAAFALRDGKLEFTDTAVGDIYNALQSELEGLQQDMRRLAEQAKKPR